MMFFFVFGEIGFESLCQFAACEHDAAPTAFTFESDVCAEARHGPFVGAARMLFAESQVIVEAEVGEHGNYRSSGAVINVLGNHYIACLASH